MPVCKGYQFMNNTYKELLDGLDNTPCQNSEFIEINKLQMAMVGPMDSQAYQYFWGCMKIYDAYGVNYFPKYLELYLGSYGDYSKGIAHRIHKDVQNGCMHSYSLRELIETLHFFGITTYQEIGLQDYERAMADAPVLYQLEQIELQQSRNEKRRKTIDAKINDYFNFGDFSESTFQNYLEKFTLKRTQKNISINEALKLAKEAPIQTYIVVFTRFGKVCYVGKTDNPLTYISLRHKKYEADGIFFDTVIRDYVDDLLLATMIYYDLPLDSMRTTKANRKYATIRQACFAYQKSESWSKKKILKAIESNKLRVIDMDLERSLIDKIELDRALRKSSHLL